MNNLVPVIAHYSEKHSSRDVSVDLSNAIANVIKANLFPPDSVFRTSERKQYN